MATLLITEEYHDVGIYDGTASSRYAKKTAVS